MFDAVSFVREKIFRRPTLTTIIAGEELSEKQTTKLGYFLLYCMFAAILASAQWTLNIIRNIPTSPTNIPSCVINVLDTFGVEHDFYENNDSTYYTYYDQVDQYGQVNLRDCPLTSVRPAFDFTTEYTDLKGAYTSILQYEGSIRKLEDEKRTLEYTQQNTQKDYDTALTEKIADETNQVYNRQALKENLKAGSTKLVTFTSQIAEQQSSIESLKSQYQSQTQALKTKVDAANLDYRKAYLLYQLFIALLSFAFSLIIFTVLYKIYVRHKIKNSPHTVIFSVATFAYGLVVIEVAGLFCWDMIPHTILEALMSFLSNFSPLLYLVQFLWPLIIITVF